MVLQYGNVFHILMILLPIAFSIISFILLRNKKRYVQKIFVLIFMLFNFVQHILKNKIWPQYIGQEFDLIQTAYNMCALMIIINPLSLILKKGALKEAINIIGMFSGFAAIAIPYWFIGESINNIEFVRYYVCHFLLAFCNLLCLLFDFNEIKIKNFYKIPSHYILFKLTIFVNTITFYLIKGETLSNAYTLIKESNPIIIFAPIDVPFVKNIIDIFTPKFFVSNGEYVPFLYSIIGEFLLISVVSFIIESIFHITKKTKKAS